MLVSSFAALSILATLSASPARAGEMEDCSTTLPVHTNTVIFGDGQITKYDLTTMGYDPNPLVYTTIYVAGDEAGNPSCVTAQLSLHNYRGIGQDYTAVNVMIDDGVVGLTPMYGHLTACADPSSPSVACALFPHDGWIQGHSYGFAKMVTPGFHRVIVYWAGVDADPLHPSPTTGTYAGGTVLTVTHQ